MKQDTKEEIGAGIAAAICLTLIVLFTLFLWAPASHYLEKWNSFWWSKDDSEISSSTSTSDDSKYYENRHTAYVACEEKAIQFFGTSEISSYASSTAENYETYDCYGVKYTKIPQ